MRSVSIRWAASLVLAMGLMLSAVPRDAAAQHAGAEATIRAQIDAFKADDFATAFGFASPQLQRMFQSPQNFQRMVTSGYPMVWRPKGLEFLEAEQRDGALWQKLRVTDAKGFAHLLDYKMIETPEGWRIAAVVLLDPPAMTA